MGSYLTARTPVSALPGPSENREPRKGERRSQPCIQSMLRGVLPVEEDTVRKSDSEALAFHLWHVPWAP